MGLEYHLFKPALNGVGPSYPIDKPQRFLLNGTKPIKFKVVDEQERPLEGIKINPLILRKTRRTSVSDYTLNTSFFARYLQTQTDASGEATFEWFPNWQQGVVDFTTYGATNFAKSYVYVDIEKYEGLHETTLSRLVPIRGKVVGVDNLPAPGITLEAAGAGLTINPPRPATAKTDAAGNYELLVAPNNIYMVVVTDRQWGSTPQQGFAVYPNTPVDDKDFKLRKATRVFGKVESRQLFGAEFMPRHRVTLYQRGMSLAEVPDVSFPEPEQPSGRQSKSIQPSISHETFADENGNFEFFVGDGDGFQLSSMFNYQIQDCRLTKVTK